MTENGMWDTPLRQDPRVAGVGRARPCADRTTLRCALGTVDDHGEVDVVLIRDADPADAADHRWW